jgi:hypothetical protein
VCPFAINTLDGHALHEDIPTFDAYEIYGRVKEDEETVDYLKHKMPLHICN